MCSPNGKQGATAGAGFRPVYVDECDLHTHPLLVQVWQRRGIPMSVPAAGVDQRRAVFSAVDSRSGQVLWQLQPRKGGVAFATFLDHIDQTWPEEHLVLVRDNGSYHRSPSVRACWVEQGGRVTPLWVPVDTPNLNLMERVWCLLEHTLAWHRFWNDVAGMENTASGILARLEARFHTDHAPGIRLVNNSCEAA